MADPTITSAPTLAERPKLRVELIGPGDVIAANEREQGFGTVRALTDWVALEPSTLAVLDGRWCERMAPWPGVQAALTCRALERPAVVLRNCRKAIKRAGPGPLREIYGQQLTRGLPLKRPETRKMA